MIAIDARYIRERPSGIGAMVDALVRLVPGLMPEQEFLLLRHPLARAPLSRAPNVREVTMQAEANGPATLLLLPHIAPLRGVTLFHAPANILPAGLPMRTVTTIHDLMWILAPELCRTAGVWGHAETLFYRNGMRRALRRSSRLISISHATHADIWKVDPRAAERTVVLPHGVDPTFCPATTREQLEESIETRARYAPRATHHVLSVGRSAPYKNHRRVVEAFALAFAKDPSIHLILIERLGAESLGLLELARGVGAAGRVHVHPTVPFSDLMALYRGATCLCQPSLTEGWGMPVGEAMSCGCPVVASDCPSLREVLGDAALYVDPRSTLSVSEALRRITTDERLRADLMRVGLHRVASFSWEEHARATVALYREVLSN